MENQIPQLEAQVVQLSEQKDDLYRDIEMLCAAVGDGSSMSESAVLMKRVVEAERSCDELRTENAKLATEKTSLLEELTTWRASKNEIDAYCRDLSAKYEELLRQRAAFFARRGSRASIGNLSLRDDSENESDNGSLFLQNDIFRIASGKENTLKENTDHTVRLKKELLSLANMSDTTALMERACEEIAVLYKRIRLLEESLVTSRQDLEQERENTRRSDSHVTTLLEQLEKRSQEEKKGKGKESKGSSRSLRKKVDRLSLDLTKAFSKMQSKEDALSETEAEMDCMKRRHSTNITLVREAFDLKYQETMELISQKEEMIRAQQHSMHLMEAEKKKLLEQISRRDLLISRLRSGSLRRHEIPEQTKSDVNGRDQSDHRKLEDVELENNMLQEKLHHSLLKQEAAERQKNEAMRKATAYKKRFVALKKRAESVEDTSGLPLVESNLNFHNFSVQWQDALNEARAQSQDFGHSSSRRLHAEAICQRYTHVAIAQFALVTLMMEGVGRIQ